MAGRLLRAVAERVVVGLDFQPRLAAAHRLHHGLHAHADFVAVVLRAFESRAGIDDLGAHHIGEVEGKTVGRRGALAEPENFGTAVDPRDLPAAGANAVPPGRQGPVETAVAIEQHGLELLDDDPVVPDQRHEAFAQQRGNPGPRAGNHGDHDQSEGNRAQQFTHVSSSPPRT